MRDLHVEFRTRDGVARVDQRRVATTWTPGETLAVLGESGSRQVGDRAGDHGHPRHPARRASPAAQILFQGQDLLQLSEERAPRRCAASEIAMIFQDALSALNPVFTVGFQIGEMFRVHRGHVPSRRASAGPIELMDRVGIPAAAAAGRATTRTSSPAACGSAS